MAQSIQVASHRDRTFYAVLALMFALSVFVGFSRTYYLKTLFGTPSLPTLTHIHAVVFTMWTLFFVFQTLLVPAGRVDLHRRIGWAGTIFAVGIAAFGWLMTLHSVRAGGDGRLGPAPLRLIHGVVDLVLFCGFFGFAVIFRRRKEVHKRLMMLAMISLMIPALGRFPLPGSMIPWLICAFSLTCVGYDLFVLRRPHVASIVGAVLINVGTPLRFVIAETHAWQGFTHWLVG